MQNKLIVNQCYVTEDDACSSKSTKVDLTQAFDGPVLLRSANNISFTFTFMKLTE